MNESENKQIKYWRIKGVILKWTSWLTWFGALAAMSFNMPFWALILLLFGFQMSNESEFCRLRMVALQTIISTRTEIARLAGASIERETKQ